MGKWTARNCDIYNPDYFGKAINSVQAMRIVARHNADIDALTAERDELQRRLDEVVAALKPAQIKWNKTSMDSPEYHAWCLVVPLYAHAVAIAEGRTE